MARRRRTSGSHFCSAASLSTVLFDFQERTSCPLLNFAQNSLRRFTDAKSGVSVLVSDADPLRARSLTPTAFVCSSSAPSDFISFEESLDFVAGGSGSSQIWRSLSQISADLMLLVGRNPFSVFNRRSGASPPCVSGSNLHTTQQLRYVAVSTVWCISRNAYHPQVAGQKLGFQVLGQFWAWQVMGQLLGLVLLGLIDQKYGPVSLQPNFSIFIRCRRRLWSPPIVCTCLCSQLIAFQEVFSATSFIWWFVPMVLSFQLRVMIQKIMETAISLLFHWRFFAEHILHLGALELPRYQISSCRGQREIVFPHCSSSRYQISSCRGQREIVFPHCSSPRYQNSSCRGQREIVFPILLLDLEGCVSETLLSDIFKGSAKVAVSMIVISVSVAVSIANNRSLLVLFVSQGIVSLTSFKVVKARRLHDIYGLSVKITCNYPFIFHVYVLCLPFEALTLLSSVVINSSFYGE